MKVRRIHTETGSHIEPPLDPNWSDLTKLQWVADVVEHDFGLRLEVRGHPLDEPDRFAVTATADGQSFGSAYYSFNEAWFRINMLGQGAEIYRAQCGIRPDAQMGDNRG